MIEFTHDVKHRDNQMLSGDLALYSAAQRLKAVSQDDCAQRFRDLGGKIVCPVNDPWFHEETLWLVHLLGIRATASTCTEALSKWIKQATDRTPRRATDGRPDCPFNGQAPSQNGDDVSTSKCLPSALANSRGA